MIPTLPRTETWSWGAVAGGCAAATLFSPLLTPGWLLGAAWVEPTPICAVALVVAIAATVRLLLLKPRRLARTLAASTVLALLLASGACLAMWRAIFGPTVTVLPPSDNGCRLVAFETQMLFSGTGTLATVPAGGHLPREVASYDTDDAPNLIAVGRHQLGWEGDVATITLEVPVSGGVHPSEFHIDCPNNRLLAPPPPPAPTPTTTKPTPTCQDGLLMEWSDIELAGPRAYLATRVTNCSQEPRPLPPSPPLDLDTDGDDTPTVTVVELPAKRPLSLAPGESAHLNLSWLLDGRCGDDVTTFTLHIDDQIATTTQECSQLDIRDGQVRAYWSTQPHE